VQGEAKVLTFTPPQIKTLRNHVLNTPQRSNGGRLAAYEEWEFEIPTLDIYAAR